MLKIKKILKKKKRIGRGIGSHGAKSGKGMKGQKSRAGYSRRAGFEGGQTPLYQRLPKGRGVKQYFKSRVIKPLAVSVNSLSQFKEGSIVGPGALRKSGFVKECRRKVKLIGKGKLDRKLTVRVHQVTDGARETVEKAGGKVEIIERENK